MKVLVIGATGFVGRSLTKSLVEHGHTVSGLARSPEAARKLVDAGLGAVEGDVLEPHTYLKALAEFDGIAFLPRIELHDEFEVVSAILDEIAGTQKSFVFTSGTGVFAEQTGGDWLEDSIAEDDPIKRSVRAGERVDTEDLVRAAADRGIKGMVVRPPMIWGHGFQRCLMAVHASAASGAVCYVGNGLNVLSSIHVDDLGDIIRLAMERGVPGALYHAVSGEQSWRAIAGEVARLHGLPLRSVDLEEARSLFGNVISDIVFSASMRARCPRTRKDLGWTPSPDRLDIFAELAHPAMMASVGSPNRDLDLYFPPTVPA